jgi:hypothetical protein
MKRRSETAHKRHRPPGWIVGWLIVVFVCFVGSQLVSSLADSLSAVVWFRSSAASVFGAYVAWLLLLPPALLLERRFHLLPIPWNRRWAAVEFVAIGSFLLAWVGWSLARKGHSTSFVVRSEIGALLAFATVLYWRAVVWSAQRKWLRWLP